MRKLTYPVLFTVEGDLIKVGEEYETRGGTTVTCYAILPDEWSVSRDAVILTDMGWHGEGGLSAHWMSLPIESKFDLMRCKREKIPYPWGDFPLAQWAATLADSKICFYNAEPTRCKGGYLSQDGIWWAHPTSTLPGIDWRTSLRKRPEGV